MLHCLNESFLGVIRWKFLQCLNSLEMQHSIFVNSKQHRLKNGVDSHQAEQQHISHEPACISTWNLPAPTSQSSTSSYLDQFLPIRLEILHWKINSGNKTTGWLRGWTEGLVTSSQRWKLTPYHPSWFPPPLLSTVESFSSSVCNQL